MLATYSTNRIRNTIPLEYNGCTNCEWIHRETSISYLCSWITGASTWNTNQCCTESNKNVYYTECRHSICRRHIEIYPWSSINNIYVSFRNSLLQQIQWKSEERPKENHTDMWLSMISSFDNIVVVDVGLPFELSKPNSIFKNQCNFSCDIDMGPVCRNYSIFVVNIATLVPLKTDIAFVLIDLLSFPIRIWINDLIALTHSEKVLTSSFSLFVHFLA